MMMKATKSICELKNKQETTKNIYIRFKTSDSAIRKNEKLYMLG